jgi:hypothetical protein
MAPTFRWIAGHVAREGTGLHPRSESRIKEKLNAIADAINAFVDYVEQMEHLMRNVESRVRRLGS